MSQRLLFPFNDILLRLSDSKNSNKQKQVPNSLRYFYIYTVYPLPSIHSLVVYESEDGGDASADRSTTGNDLDPTYLTQLNRIFPGKMTEIVVRKKSQNNN